MHLYFSEEAASCGLPDVPLQKPVLLQSGFSLTGQPVHTECICFSQVEPGMSKFVVMEDGNERCLGVAWAILGGLTVCSLYMVCPCRFRFDVSQDLCEEGAKCVARG